MSNYRANLDGSWRLVIHISKSAAGGWLEDYCFRREISKRFEMICLVVAVIIPIGPE